MHLPLGLLHVEAILGKKQKCYFSRRNEYFRNEISSQRSSITTCYDAVPGCPEPPLGDQTEIHHCLPDQIMLSIRCIITNNNNNNNDNKMQIKVTLLCGPTEDQIKQRYVIVYHQALGSIITTSCWLCVTNNNKKHPLHMYWIQSIWVGDWGLRVCEELDL